MQKLLQTSKAKLYAYTTNGGLLCSIKAWNSKTSQSQIKRRRYTRVLTSLENLEMSGNFVTMENSGNLKCTQGIFLPFAVFFMVQSATNNARLFTIWYLWTATVVLLLVVVHRISVDVIIVCFEVVAKHLQSCQRFWRQPDCFIMTFYLVRIQFLSVWFSLYNCLEKTTQTVWKTWKTRGISFCQICKHPVYTGNQKEDAILLSIFSEPKCQPI